jgi:hypothetical protein
MMYGKQIANTGYGSCCNLTYHNTLEVQEKERIAEAVLLKFTIFADC